jgi:hypothetical protein
VGEPVHPHVRRSRLSPTSSANLGLPDLSGRVPRHQPLAVDGT